MKKNSITTTKRQRATIQRPKDKEQQYKGKRQRARIQQPKDKEQRYSDQKKKNNNTATF